MNNPDQLLHQAQLQQNKLELETRFRNNLAFFREAAPGIYQEYVSYTPKKLKLLMNEQGQINLVNMGLKNKPVYAGEPQTSCREQVERFQQQPLFYYINLTTREVLGEAQDTHLSNINTLLRNLPNQPIEGGPLESNVPFMVILGIGLGYHIEQLLEKTDIRHICIIEPHEDCFFASLFTIDWYQLYQHFNKPDYTFNLIIGKKPAEGVNMLKQHIEQIGLFYTIKAYVFDHLSSPEMKASSRLFFENLASMVSSQGYFDDERIGLAHTLANYRNNIPIMRDHIHLHKKPIDLPAFVIANGPSLDKAKDFLLENRDKAIVFSCGTALGSLYKLGIKPDFHIEMERTRPVVEWLEASTDPEYRNDIIMLGLNTVHPDAYRLFQQRGIGMKANDLGNDYLLQFLQQGQPVVNMLFSNPTVGNAGLSFAASMGFKNIYLFGMDFGFSSDGQHHSSLSKHYDIKDEHVEALNLYQYNQEGNLQLPGNFGGTVTSNVVYANARLVIEELLDYYADINCFNTSEGLLIQGARPVHYADIKLPAETLDKHTCCQALFERHFHLKGFNQLKGEPAIVRDFKPAATLLDQTRDILVPDVASKNQAFDQLRQSHTAYQEASTQADFRYAGRIVKGSLSSFHVALAYALNKGKTEEESVQWYNTSKQHFLQFLTQAKAQLGAEFLRKDTRSRQLSEKVKNHEASS